MVTDDTPDTHILRRIAETITRGVADLEQHGPQPTRPRMAEPAQHLAKLAHELKTPLSAIVAAAEIMRDERFGPIGDARYHGYAADIFESASHVLGVINAMLGSRASDRTTDQDESALAYAEIDLNDLTERVTSSVRALVEAAGLEVSAKLQPGLPHIIADPGSVRQMLLNLITNAIRATPAGGHIRLETGYQLAGSVHLSVTDTGSGMTPDEIARVLDETRESDFEPTQSGGIGIGYPLVLSLAKLNGAAISISRASERGTKVQISFAPDRVVPV